MSIPIWLTVKGVIVGGLILLGLTYFAQVDLLKEKESYDSVSGQVMHIGKSYGNYPKRHKGEFRYLVLSNYDYPFEIYEPNSMPSTSHLDSLSVGDSVTVYYFERDFTYRDGINKFAQFVDQGKVEVFIRNDFQKQLGYGIMMMSIGLMILAVWMGSQGYLPW